MSGLTAGTQRRYIRHDLSWAPTALVSFTAQSTFELKLTLNDSNDSALGPGIYLDMDTVAFDSNLPEAYGDWYTPLFSPYEKIFISGSNAPETLIANQLYFVQFTSLKPGQAAQDNAELTITHTQSDCWLFCNSGAYCHIHDNPFSLQPIPGRVDWTPIADRCSEWSRWFLPLLRHAE